MPVTALDRDKDLQLEHRAENRVDLQVALLTGGHDISYVYGLATTLSARRARIHVVGGDGVDHVEFHTSDRIRFVHIGGMKSNAGFAAKLFQLAAYYLRLLTFITFSSPKLIHILWNGKLEYFDRTVLMIYLKLLGKKILLTAHNVNKAKRDSRDSMANRLTLKIQYRMVDRVFVHTEKMKDELSREFGASQDRIRVIPFGINILVGDTDLTPIEAKRKLGLQADERTILFYGRVVPYKGLDCLLEAFDRLARRDAGVRLIIAGEPMKGSEAYIEKVRQAIATNQGFDRITCRLEFIPEHETELYFKAADVLALPYRNIFESGVLFLAYRFGLPAVASDVGSFGEELSRSGAGLVFEAGNSSALTDTLVAFFKSELYNDAEIHRRRIQAYSRSRHSWGSVVEITEEVYRGLLTQRGAASNDDMATVSLGEQAGPALPDRRWNGRRES